MFNKFFRASLIGSYLAISTLSSTYASDSDDKSKRPMPTISAYTPADEARIRETRAARAALGAYVDSCQTGGAAWDASHAAKKAELQAKK
jgi:hypothetical protein